MDLKERIKNDLKDSMKNGDVISRSVLRLLNTDIKNAEIEEQKELSDIEVIKIISRSIKKRNDSIEQYKKGNRVDLAESEEKELEVLKKYMPAQMNKEEINVLVKETIRELKASGASDFGKVMKEVMQKTKGMADGKIVSMIVKEELGKIGE